MIEFEKPSIEQIEYDEAKNFGKFVCEPLEGGYGMTLGNSLRRVLLSSLPGAAITGVKIEGVQHEFSSIPNVVEDVMEIILNLKNVRFRMDTNQTKVLKISKKGVGEVTAADISEDSDITVLNKDLHIATLSEGAKFNVELRVKRDRGYNSVDKNKVDEEEIGYITIDSIFTPVKKVNYTVENTRVGNRVDYDKLTMFIWTDGSVTPQEALGLAAKTMNEHLQLFIGLSPKAEKVEIMKEAPKVSRKEILDTKVEELGLTKRPLNCLKIQQITTLRELLAFKKSEVTRFKNLGKKSFEEIESKVEELGLDFKEEN